MLTAVIPKHVQMMQNPKDFKTAEYLNSNFALFVLAYNGFFVYDNLLY